MKFNCQNTYVNSFLANVPSAHSFQLFKWFPFSIASTLNVFSLFFFSSQILTERDHWHWCLFTSSTPIHDHAYTFQFCLSVGSMCKFLRWGTLFTLNVSSLEDQYPASSWHTDNTSAIRVHWRQLSCRRHETCPLRSSRRRRINSSWNWSSTLRWTNTTYRETIPHITLEEIALHLRQDWINSAELGITHLE